MMAVSAAVRFSLSFRARVEIKKTKVSDVENRSIAAVFSVSTLDTISISRLYPREECVHKSEEFDALTEAKDATGMPVAFQHSQNLICRPCRNPLTGYALACTMREKRKMKLGRFSAAHETDGFR
jgi:hypothetical protein